MIDIIKLKEIIKKLIEGKIIHNSIEEELSVRRGVNERSLKEFVRSLIHLEKYINEDEDSKLEHIKKHFSLTIDKKGIKVEVSFLAELFKRINDFVSNETSLIIFHRPFICELFFSEIINYFFKDSKVKIKLVDIGNLGKTRTASFRIMAKKLDNV